MLKNTKEKHKAGKVSRNYEWGGGCHCFKLGDQGELH